MVKAQSQTFALIVTAEPYYAVRIPSELVVLVNETRKNTKGKIYPDNSYKLMRRSEYSKQGNPLALKPDLKKVPLDMYEARNAVEIAKSRGAEQYAQVFAKAQSSLQSAENVLAQDSGKNQVISAARQTVQFAEDARAWLCDAKRPSVSNKKGSGFSRCSSSGEDTSGRGGSRGSEAPSRANRSKRSANEC